MIIMALLISYCLSIPIDGDEMMNGGRQKRDRFHIGPPRPYESWRDGNGRFRIGPPSPYESWRDGNGRFRIGPPSSYESWRSKY